MSDEVTPACRERPYMTPSVSLIIPTRNRAALLTRMLHSLDRALAAVDGEAQVVWPTMARPMAPPP